MDIKLNIGNDGLIEMKTNPRFDKTISSIKDVKLRIAINGLAAIMRPVSKMVYKDIRSCIGTSRMMIGVLKKFGYEAEILSVTTEIWNSDLIKLYKKKFSEGLDSPAKFMQWASTNRSEYDATGAHLITLGEPVPGAVGHYGVYLPKQNLFMDATLDQANRPHKSVELNSFVLSELPYNFLQNGPLALEMHKCRIVYHSSKNENYKTSVDWTDRDPDIQSIIDDIFGTIIATPQIFR